MNFKEWFILVESTEEPSPLQAAFIAYKDNPHDNNVQNNFYSNIMRFTNHWCKKMKFSITRSRTEDLVSDVYTKLARKINDPVTGAEFLNNLRYETFPQYLSVVINHAAMDEGRKNNKLNKFGGVSIDASNHSHGGEDTVANLIVNKNQSVEEKIASNEEGEKVRIALEKLSPKDRELIDLTYYKGMEYGTAAEKLGIPVGTMKSGLFAAKKRLRQHLENLA